MKQTTELELARPAREQQPSVALMLQAVIDKGVTADNVGALEKLVGLYERMQQKDAEKAFAEAFVRLQSEIPTIQGARPVHTKTGELKFRYANFDDIDAIIRPICLRNGFTYAFRETGVENGRITVTMTLQHSGGHFREIPCSVRVGSGPPGATESQADMSGHAYAQRGALESGLALRIVGAREDAGVESGGNITEAQAFDLEQRVALLNQDHGKFLKWLGVSRYQDIPTGKHEMADQFLTKKENQK